MGSDLEMLKIIPLRLESASSGLQLHFHNYLISKKHSLQSQKWAKILPKLSEVFAWLGYDKFIPCFNA